MILLSISLSISSVLFTVSDWICGNNMPYSFNTVIFQFVLFSVLFPICFLFGSVINNRQGGNSLA